jgi:hypothetical protein
MTPPKKAETEDERGRRMAEETARKSLGPLRQRVDIFTRAQDLLAKGEPDYGPFHPTATTFAVLTGLGLRPAQVALLLLITKTVDERWDYDSPDKRAVLMPKLGKLAYETYISRRAPRAMAFEHRSKDVRETWEAVADAVAAEAIADLEVDFE